MSSSVTPKPLSLVQCADVVSALKQALSEMEGDILVADSESERSRSLTNSQGRRLAAERSSVKAMRARILAADVSNRLRDLIPQLGRHVTRYVPPEAISSEARDD